ncbi:MAG: hypothetical protein FWF08_07225, partial [Oscillospiraceae bacterium]|nr:hypothetical protein [Oscillospiraceae bacterium]
KDDKKIENPYFQVKTESYLQRRKETNRMDREELKSQIDELMRQYADEEIDGATYTQKMLELTTSYQNENQEKD